MDSASMILSDYETREIATVDGLTLSVRDYAPLAPATGQPVLCLHGLTRNSADFEILAPRIAALGRRVIVPDMRGRGRSAYDPDPAHYVPTVYAQDVLTLLDALAIPQAVFIGSSMGAIIAMVVAALAPDRIAGAVLNDVGPKLEQAGLARIGGYVGRGGVVRSWEEAAEAMRAINGSAFPQRLDDDGYWRDLARRNFRERPDGALEPAYDESIALAFTDPETAASTDMTPLFRALVAKPVLSVRGALSDLLSPRGVADMRAMKPDLMAIDVPEVGHAPMLDEPEAWDAVLDFLARAP
ncbi:MAG: alpha/beta fold hydrolase [Hyphomonadaceae bacterium]